jgi:hypothetical protein
MNGFIGFLQTVTTINCKRFTYSRTSEITAVPASLISLLQPPLSVSWQWILTQEL